jgi:hypothetical protein
LFVAFSFPLMLPLFLGLRVSKPFFKQYKK